MERRLAAILAADVVGYTALMGADESGTLRRLTDLRREFLEPLIDEHRGRTVKLMGDGFGAAARRTTKPGRSSCSCKNRSSATARMMCTGRDNWRKKPSR